MFKFLTKNTRTHIAPPSGYAAGLLKEAWEHGLAGTRPPRFYRATSRYADAYRAGCEARDAHTN